MISLLVAMSACEGRSSLTSAGEELFRQDNLVAWCIVPFDAMNRGPEERAVMLKESGFTKFAWDWRDEHIESFAAEIKALHENGVELYAVWMPLEHNELSPQHLQIIREIENAGITTTYWVYLSESLFSGLTDEEKVTAGAAAVAMVHDRAARTGSRVAMYNHLGWSGEPENQVHIIKKLNREGVGIVYNFHHAHHQVDDFERLLILMMPYLYTVNLNGMKADGPKIMDIGAGNIEAAMIRSLSDSGFGGTVGILGHIEDEDAEIVLQRNLEGLKKLVHQR